MDMHTTTQEGGTMAAPQRIYPSPAHRTIINDYLRGLGAQVSLDETHPVGDTMLEGMYAVADAAVGGGDTGDWAVCQRVAQTIMVLNYGPACLVAGAVA